MYSYKIIVFTEQILKERGIQGTTYYFLPRHVVVLMEVYVQNTKLVVFYS